MSSSTKRFVLLGVIYLFCSYIRVCFQVMLSSENMYDTRILLMGYSGRLELNRVCSSNGF